MLTRRQPCRTSPSLPWAAASSRGRTTACDAMMAKPTMLVKCPSSTAPQPKEACSQRVFTDEKAAKARPDITIAAQYHMSSVLVCRISRKGPSRLRPRRPLFARVGAARLSFGRYSGMQQAVKARAIRPSTWPQRKGVAPPKCSARSPPIAGPMTIDAPVTTKRRPRATERSVPGEVASAMQLDSTAPPELRRPPATCAAARICSDGAAAMMAASTAKAALPKRIMLLRPIRSDIAA
mmetsp:Transcript_16772/g.36812  ORF Transcript_16772/g.36812 Transcript_16772/m.36812 type:complete len:237 (-) Transcript_16772:330-1040(-)